MSCSVKFVAAQKFVNLLNVRVWSYIKLLKILLTDGQCCFAALCLVCMLDSLDLGRLHRNSSCNDYFLICNVNKKNEH